MIIELKKFGTTLTSRPAGKEALAAFRPTLQDVAAEETISIDFSGVVTFTPSWADEFLSPLLGEFGGRLVLSPSDNPSVKATLEILEKSSGKQFTVA